MDDMAPEDPSHDDMRMPSEPLERSTLLTVSKMIRDQILHHMNDVKNDTHSHVPLIQDAHAFMDGARSTVMKGRMHWHQATFIHCNDDLKKMVEATTNADFGNNTRIKKLLDKVLSFWQSANSLKLLERFTDLHQQLVVEKPGPDGSNLDVEGQPEVVFEWLLRRSWIRHLHLPGLHAANSGREESFYYLYECARGLLELEIAICPTNMFTDFYTMLYGDDPNGIVSWIGFARRVIKDVLEDVASVPYTKSEREVLRQLLRQKAGLQPSPGENLTREATFQQNFAQYPMQTLTSMVDRYNELVKDHPFERLIMELIGKEDIFEQTLTTEHVEDKLVSKQVTASDDRWLLENARLNPNDDFYPWNVQEILQGIGGTAKSARAEQLRYRMLAAMSFVNRQRRNFRLLREWSDERPWKTMYQPYDTTGDDNKWLVDAIKEFDQHKLDNVYKIQDVIDTGAPISHPVVHRSNMFGIKPADGIKDAPKQPCFICKVKFAPGNTFDHVIMQTHCDHYFHLKCIFSYWDHPNRHLHTCPECGRAPQLLYERVGISHNASGSAWNTANPSFTHNLDGYSAPDFYRAPTDPTKPDRSQKQHDAMRRVFYDIPDRLLGISNFYWERENAHVVAYDKADLWWTAGGRTDNFLTEPMQGYARLVRSLTARWRAQNPGALDTALFYDASRFPIEVEVGYIRHRRRIRNRQRRDRFRAQGAGLV